MVKQKKLDFWSQSIIKNCAKISGQNENLLIKNREESMKHWKRQKRLH